MIPKYELKFVQTGEIDYDFKIEMPYDLETFIKEYLHLNEMAEEHLIIVYLSPALDMLSYDDLGGGTMNQILSSPREIYKRALLHNAHAIAIAHNHLSTSYEPTQTDMDFTKRLELVGQIVGIELIEHQIITLDGIVYSFCDENKIGNTEFYIGGENVKEMI